MIRYQPSSGRDTCGCSTKNGTVVFAERLPHESLFLMAGKTQKNFKHEVPKEPEVALPRINLTFRHI